MGQHFLWVTAFIEKQSKNKKYLSPDGVGMETNSYILQFGYTVTTAENLSCISGKWIKEPMKWSTYM